MTGLWFVTVNDGVFHQTTPGSRLFMEVALPSPEGRQAMRAPTLRQHRESGLFKLELFC
jgi:hypothetical protein